VKILSDLIGVSNRGNVRLSDIKNEVVKLKRLELVCKSSIEALLDFLKDYVDDNGKTSYHKHAYNPKGRVCDLFFANSDAFEPIKNKLDVLQIDASYKNDKFDMPLHHAVLKTC
jgi:hypothetical protein